jgi:hypothetical protein
VCKFQGTSVGHVEVSIFMPADQVGPARDRRVQVDWNEWDMTRTDAAQDVGCEPSANLLKGEGFPSDIPWGWQ